MAHRVGVVGASGYGGAELLRLLHGHPALALEVVAAHGNAGARIGALYPNLTVPGEFSGVDPDALAALELVLLATPHEVSLRLAGDLVDAGVRVVDLSGAFRLGVDDLAAWYGTDNDRPDLAPDASPSATVYGLSEWVRDEVADATLVANPGCYPTAALLGLLPLVALVEPDSVVVDAKSGTSGAGRGLRDDLHHAHVSGDHSAYGAPGHRHTIEIERWLTGLGGVQLGTISFTPHLLPVARGLLATMYADVRPGITTEDVQTALHDAYDDEPFLRVLAPGDFPHIKAVAGSNACHVSAVVDDRTGRVVVTSAIDNLGKGAAGQALQNANLLLGLDETLGLTAQGLYP